MAVDRREPEKGTIVLPQHFGYLRLLHGFMQSIRVPFDFVSRGWSILPVRTFSYGDDRDFDFRDNPLLLTLSIRMGGVGIVASLQDGAVNSAYGEEYYARLDDIELHPVQFAELAAKMNYATYLISRAPRYVTVTSDEPQDGTIVASLPVRGTPSRPVFDEWDQREFAHFLATYWSDFPGLTEDVIFREPDSVLSFLDNPDGTLRRLDPGFLFE